MAIKVSELIQALQALPAGQRDLPVVLAVDDEGNGYRGLEDWLLPGYTEEDNLWRIDSVVTEADWADWQDDFEDATVAFVPNVMVLG